MPNKVLALLLLNPGINFISNVNTLAGGLHTFPYLYFFAQGTALLFGPLVLIYTQQLIKKKISLHNPMYWLTAAALMLHLYFSIEFLFLPSQQQYSYLDGILNEPYPYQMVIINAVFIILQQAYFTVAAVQVYLHRRKIFSLLSSLHKTKVDYATKFILLIWLLNLITIVLYIVLPSIDVEYNYLPIVLTIIYSFILYFSISHNSIFTQESYTEFQQENENLSIPKNTVNNAPEEIVSNEIKETAEQLERYINHNEPFTNPELTLAGISQEMNIPARKISIALNKIIGKTFYDYINEKRIEKSKVLLVQRKEITIEGVAYESGFSSRASFYRAFKKYTGKTPTEHLGT